MLLHGSCDQSLNSSFALEHHVGRRDEGFPKIAYKVIALDENLRIGSGPDQVRQNRAMNRQGLEVERILEGVVWEVQFHAMCDSIAAHQVCMEQGNLQDWQLATGTLRHCNMPIACCESDSTCTCDVLLR